MVSKAGTGALASLFSLFVSASAAFAHSVPVSYSPKPNSTVSAPSQLTIQFSEQLEPRFSLLSVSGPDGKPVTQQKSQLNSKDAKTLTLSLPALHSGTYSVHWVAVASDDGHRLQGDYKFTVK